MMAPPKNHKLDLSYLLNDNNHSGGGNGGNGNGGGGGGGGGGCGGNDVSRRKCRICGHVFTQVGDLRKHIRTVHQKLRPYKCQECGKTFGENGT